MIASWALNGLHLPLGPSVTAGLFGLRSHLVLLGFGTLMTLAGVTTDLIALCAAGTVVAGIGFGAAGPATFDTFARIAEPHERGALFAVAFVISHLALSVPAVIVPRGSGAVHQVVELATAGAVQPRRELGAGEAEHGTAPVLGVAHLDRVADPALFDARAL